MEAKIKGRRLLIKRLRNKYRLVIMNDSTFEEKASWKLTPMNVFVSVGSFLILFMFLLTYIIAFTPLREYIPGYADVNLQRQVRVLTKQVQNLQEEIDANDLLLKNIRSVANGEAMTDASTNFSKEQFTAKYDSLRALHSLPHSAADSILREQVESELKAAANMDSGSKKKHHHE